ncbi:MAG: NAD(P)-dependent oxidoreductase [candidate division KSB1 bacterium]|jgi:nucleoside-diphosphate-sugar epimerase|nr:NAD(P)-dependent oxidoreductase [candidate division KSB1 bacterium]
MKALITGSNGFIGSHLVELLLNHDYEATCMVRKTSKLQWIEHLPVHFVYGDIRDIDSLRNAVSGMDYVFHLGGTVRAGSDEIFNAINYLGTENLLKACKDHTPRLKKFIFISSQAAAGPAPEKRPLKESDIPRPISMYGRSKLKAEQAVLRYSDIYPVSIIRPPSVYGARDDDILELFKYIKWRIKPVLGYNDKYISIFYVLDLVDGILRVAEKEEANGEIFFLANKEYHSTLEIENMISAAMDRSAMTIRIPEIALDIFTGISEFIARFSSRVALVNRDKALEMKQPYWIMDPGKALKHLAFQAETDFEEGLAETLEWYRANRWL